MACERARAEFGANRAHTARRLEFRRAVQCPNRSVAASRRPVSGPHVLRCWLRCSQRLQSVSQALTHRVRAVCGNLASEELSRAAPHCPGEQLLHGFLRDPQMLGNLTLRVPEYPPKRECLAAPSRELRDDIGEQHQFLVRVHDLLDPRSFIRDVQRRKIRYQVHWHNLTMTQPIKGYVASHRQSERPHRTDSRRAEALGCKQTRVRFLHELVYVGCVVHIPEEACPEDALGLERLEQKTIAGTCHFGPFSA